MFIIRNFYAQFKHWPTNMTQVKAFADEPRNFQPEFPDTFDNPVFDNAVFGINSDGGLKIYYQNGSMSLGKPK